MGRFKLTTPAKVLIFIVIVAAVAFGVWHFVIGGNSTDGFNLPSLSSDSSSSDSTYTGGSNEINLSLDEWIGWKPIIDANQGLETQPGSIFDKLGIKVNIKIINDAAQSSNALIKGDLNSAGYTINRTAFLSQKFKENGLSVVMPIITNYSNGGDGIIASSKFKTVESLVNAKIGVPRYSEAQTLVLWFIDKSDLPQNDKDKIINNLIMFDTPDDCAKAFFSGKIDVAATWQPYISQALSGTDSIVLFDTKTSNKLIMDGIVFRKDFANSNPDTIAKFIDGVLQANSQYDTEFKYIKDSMPLFATSSDSDIKAACADAGLANWSANMETLQSEAPTIYNDMCTIWSAIGENPDRDLGKTLFDTMYMGSLSDKYSGTESVEKKSITQAQKDSVVDSSALLTKTATINFVADTAKFVDTAQAAQVLDEFISIAKTLDGAIIQIEGNINAATYTDGGQKLSEERAKTVANYFIANGIDPNRIIIIGNGNKKMIGSTATEEGKAQNRRTDIFFKTIEQ